MEENKTKVVSPGLTILFCLTMQQRTQKKVFFAKVASHTRKSQIAVTTQASWHNNFNSQTVYCNKLRTTEVYNLQKHTNNPHLHLKRNDF